MNCGASEVATCQFDMKAPDAWLFFNCLSGKKTKSDYFNSKSYISTSLPCITQWIYKASVFYKVIINADLRK